MKKIYLLALLLAPLTMQGQHIEKLQKKVAVGDTKAMIELAECCEAGYGVAVDSARALELYRQAEARGNKDALGHLSRYAFNYSGLQHDSAECYRLAKASADAGAPYGVYRLGWCYRRGVGVPRDLQRARQLYEQSMNMGCVQALEAVGDGYLSGSYGYARDIERGYELLSKLPDGRCTSDKCESIAQYYSLKGDAKNAVKWLKKGIADGQPSAWTEYVFYHFHGFGMPKNEREALNELHRIQERCPNTPWLLGFEADLRLSATDTTLCDNHLILSLYKQASSVRHSKANGRIGNSYQHAIFTPYNTDSALYYWHRGVRLEDVLSMMGLAYYHAQNENVDSARHYALMACEYEESDAAGLLARLTYGDNPDQALAYAIQAADWGDESFRVSAAEIFAARGDTARAMQCYDRAIHNAYYDAYVGKSILVEVKEGRKRALKLLEEGAQKGSTKCYLVLGRVAEQEGRYKEAARYYEKSNEPQGCYHLASMLLNATAGKGSKADTLRAMQLMHLAAQADNRDAIFWLAYTYSHDTAYASKIDSAIYWFDYLSLNGDAEAMMQMAFAYEYGRGVDADTVSAMDYYTRAGEAGCSDGYAYVGDFYRTGFLSAKPDSAQAFHYYQMAAAIEDNNTNALFYMGDSYLRGIGVAKDTVAALPYLRQAAAQGSYRAMGLLGDYYNYGWGGITPNGDSALTYYYEASKGDDPRGDYQMGQWFYDRADYAKALPYLASAAGNGSVPAYVTYAHALLFGNGIEANPTQAAEILHKIAPVDKQGRAHLMLAVMHFQGNGVVADTVEAFRCLDTAIARGHLVAMTLMGDLLAEGEVVQRDTVAAVKWYERAAQAGSVNAMLTLASNYQNGIVAPKNLKRAAELLQQATDRGNLEAQCRLGLCYEEGEGVILNSRKAYNLYLDAAERGSAYGMYLTAMCYIDGVYVQENKAQAAQWFLKGAEAGNLACCYFVGAMYADGDGLKKNKKEAKRWLTLAADNGVEAAAKKLNEL